MNLFKSKFDSMYPNAGRFYSGAHDRDRALSIARWLRNRNIYATIWHVAGPRTGLKSQYAVVTS